MRERGGQRIGRERVARHALFPKLSLFCHSINRSVFVPSGRSARGGLVFRPGRLRLRQRGWREIPPRGK